MKFLGSHGKSQLKTVQTLYIAKEDPYVKMYKGNFFLLNSLVMLGKLSNGNFNPNIWLATKFSSKEQLVVVVCLLCYCNIQAGFHHGTINKGKSDDHYNGKGGKCEGYTDFIFVALFSKSYFIHVWEENIPQSLFNFSLCYQNWC